MWHPEPGWQPLRVGASPSTVGAWLVVRDHRRHVVKRLQAPIPGDPEPLSDPRSHAYWHREVDVALDGLAATSAGIVAPTVIGVDEDDTGATLSYEFVEAEPLPGLFLARALGRFARTPADDRPWLAHRQLRGRLRQVEHRGGWPTLARTSVADVADHLWRRRTHFLDALDRMPWVLQHGDPTPANLLGRRDDSVVAIDWATLGLGPAGSDLGLLALAVRDEFDPLLEAYTAGLGDAGDRDQVIEAARITAVFTALTRAEWALARVAPGEGALAGKFRHPSVAPHLLVLQRQFPLVEALLG